MSIYEIDAKVKELRELRNMEAEVKSAITAIEDSLKAEMLAKNTDVLSGKDYTITWKTVITNRREVLLRLNWANKSAWVSLNAALSKRLVITVFQVMV